LKEKLKDRMPSSVSGILNNITKKLVSLKNKVAEQEAHSLSKAGFEPNQLVVSAVSAFPAFNKRKVEVKVVKSISESLWGDEGALKSTIQEFLHVVTE